MNYKEYINAADRHVAICQQLLRDAEVERNRTKKSHLVNEAYYLSGYIMECSLSYALFYNERLDVESHRNYQGEFLTHNLMSKVNFVVRSVGVRFAGVPFVSIKHVDKNLNRLFGDWDVRWRYEKNKTVDEAVLRKYIDALKDVKDKIEKQYPKR